MAAGNTYESIATTTLGSAATTVTLSSIPSTYTDLVLVVNFGTTAAGEVTGIKLNGDTGTNYSTTSAYGATAQGAISFRRANDSIGMNLSNWFGSSTTLNGSNGVYHIMNYSNTTTYKTVLGRSNDASMQTEMNVGLWRNTAAVTSVTFLVTTTTLKAGATVSLYGIKAA